MFGAESADGGGAEAIGKCGIVEKDGRDLGLADGDNGHAILWEAIADGDAFGSAADCGDDLVAHFVRVSAQSEAHRDFFRDDVALRAATDGADGEDGRLLRVDLACHDGLREDDEFGGHEDGILAVLWGGAVRADPSHGDVDAGGAGLDWSALDGDGAGRVDGCIMFGEDEVGAAEALIEVVGEHGAGAVDGFFRWLADEHYGSVPLGFALGQFAGGTEENGDVDVMTARVHDADILALGVGRANCGGVVEGSLLFDWESVHVGANEETRAGAVLEDCDDAVCLGAILVFADVLGDGVAELAKFGGKEGGGLPFVVGKLGIAMEVLVGFGESGELFVDRGRDIGWGLGGG